MILFGPVIFIFELLDKISVININNLVAKNIAASITLIFFLEKRSEFALHHAFAPETNTTPKPANLPKRGHVRTLGGVFLLRIGVNIYSLIGYLHFPPISLSLS